MDETSIIITAANTIGEIIKLALASTFNGNLLQTMLLIIKNNVIKSTGEFLK